jgi:hypothetical protein
MPLEVRKGQTISILVENQGRVCFGSEVGESKVSEMKKLFYNQILK